MQPRDDLTPAQALGGLTLLVLFALCVRSLAMGALLPHMVEPDADYVRQALVLRAHRAGELPDLRSMLPDYPLLLPWLLSFLPITPPAPAPSAPLAEHLAAASAPFLWGRRLVSALSLLLVPATYAIGCAVLSRGGALLAAALAASSLTHVLYAQQARPHAAFVALLALALAACLQLRRTGTPAAHVLAGAACGLALATLHFGVFLFPALALAAWLAPGRRWSRLALALAPALLALWLGYPMLFATSGIDAQQGALGLTGHRLFLDRFHGRGFWIVPWLAFAHEPVLCSLVVLALAVAIRRRIRGEPLVGREHRADLAVLAGFGLPYWIVLGAFDQAWDKYGLPLLPLACLFGAAAAGRIGARVLRGRMATLLGAALVLALPVLACARFAWLRTVPDSSARVAAWIEGELDREVASIALHPALSLPLLRRPPDPDPVPDWALSPWDRYQREHPELATRADAWRIEHLYVPSQGAMPGRAVLEQEVLESALAGLDADWFVLERRGAWQAPDDRTREALLASGAELRESFEPYDPQRVTLDSRGWVLGNQALLRVLTARHGGPRLELWRLRGAR